MDTVKIGKFLAELRRGRGLTQEQLGERLGTSNKTISRWENGNYMPPVEMLMELSSFFGVSINEILSGKRLEQSEEKQAAEDNLKEMLKESRFTLEERKAYFTKKWKRDHRWIRVLNIFVLLVLIIVGFCLESILTVGLACPVNAAFNIISYNKMMSYVEYKAFDVENKLKKS